MHHPDIQFHWCVPGKYCRLTSADERMRPPLFNRQMGATCATLFKGYPMTFIFRKLYQLFKNVLIM